jgi:hypothetical protein
MKRFIAVVVVVALLVIGIGFYRGWFAVSSSEADKASNKVNVNLTVDRDKIEEDAEAVKNKTTELTGKITNPASDPAPAAAAER